MVQGSPKLPRSSRFVDVGLIGQDGMALTLAADDAERRALAALNGLVRVDRLEADLRLRREGGTGVHVTGTVAARITQTCVVTVEDFDTDVVETVDVHFLPEREVEAKAAEALRAAARLPEAERPDEDLPDPIVNGRIDVAALMAEFLALGLDPYPKKPDAVFVEPRPAADEPRVSPFAALDRLRTERPN